MDGPILTCVYQTESSVDATKARDTDLLKHLARRFNLTYTAFGEHLSPADAPAHGTLSLRAPYMLEPAPITPTDAAPYVLFAGTIKATYAAHRVSLAGDDDVIVRPGIMSGNTGECFSELVATSEGGV